MAAVNARRVWLGALAGGVAWLILDMAINRFFLGPRYAEAQKAGLFLPQPRYPFFVGYWIITLFLVSYILAWTYVSVRATLGPGPGTALRVGFLVGFVASFPMNLATATWSPISRVFPLVWMLDYWVGAILASLVAGWLYKD